ncbi:MAG TPA: glycoside hydrolase family 3 N-terminal domain-containing protein [Chitinophagales bacterium]|nr:glycoside hydrolase family 3 N-terminal domain-containing protein [Chitinophagales bacterium]
MIQFLIKSLTVLCLVFATSLQANTLPPYMLNVPVEGQQWVDSMMNVLTPEEKVAQLFMISAYSNKDEAHYREIENFIKKYKIGGLIMMQGTPEKQAELINRFQANSKVPLMIGFDGEWGLSMRLKNVIDYPRQMVLGALSNDLLLYDMGREFARQMKLVGIHVNFAPVVDVNNNPNNPVINDRSFGEDVPNVIRKSVMYMKGLQEGGVMACAKHFPGHGDTDVDSHYDLPTIKQTKARLDSIELKPFRALAYNGIGSMMVAHLSIPSLDNAPNLPSTLSPKIIDGILRKDIGYQGLVFTDAMNMKGITKYFPSGPAEVKALLAGNDIMLFSDNVPQAMEGVLKAIKENVLTQDLIDEKVRKVLLAKYWLGLNKKPVLNTQNLDAKINTEYAEFLKEKLLTEAITVVTDKNNLIPIGDLSKYKIAAVHISGNSKNELTRMLNKYGEVNHFYISKDASQSEFDQLRNQLKEYNLVINAHFDLTRSSSRKYGLTTASTLYLQKVNAERNTINILFGIPYVLNRLEPLNTIVIANVDDSITQSATAQIIFGGLGATARLPVKSGTYPAMSGVSKLGGTRLKYLNPMYMGIDPQKFNGVDKLALETIKMGATPGCQILVVYKDAVIYDKAFGHQTYKGIPVQTTDLYDIASITKIAATAPILMHMGELGKFDVTKKLSDYLPELKGNKRNLVIKDILAHQSGLPAWIPFYKKTLDDTKQPNSKIYSKDSSEQYGLKVAHNMYMDIHYMDTIYKDIEDAALQEARYRYSDLGYYFMKKIIEKQFNQTLDVVADSLIWKRLGGTRTMYNPLQHGVSLKEIAPTEEDKSFRMQKIHGYVHDQGAAMMGGVAGHAGLFSNANDLAKYFQMLLNKGFYGGVQFFQPQSVEKFTTKVGANNRRALAFDKPVMTGGEGPTCDCVSAESFGHTGFTGTIAWADPKNEIIFIFLSNRTFPDAENRLLINQNIRPRLQQIITDAIGVGK